MISLSLQQLATALNGQLVGEDTTIKAVSTDSRKCDHDSLFIALKGERFDAHEFAAKAVDNGAKALLVERKLPLNVPQVVVGNTHTALGLLGQLVRQQVAPIAVALTGSNGKTSVKEMVATILSQQFQVLFTAGNFNNDIGVPLTLLRLSAGDQYGVFELGANHQGEINYTSSLVKPQVALVNNIGSAHLEGFGSVEGIAQAKSEIFNHLVPDGTAVINADDEFAEFMATKAAAFKQLRFSRESDVIADVRATSLVANAQGCYYFSLEYASQTVEVQLPLTGIHQVSNALASASICLALGLDLSMVASGLSLLQPVKGRMMPKALGRFLVVDDSYNANPSSVSAAINWLQQRQHYRCLVLGDLGELGDNAAPLHEQLGQQAKMANIDALYCCGSLSAHASRAFGSQHFQDVNELAQMLIAQLNQLPGEATILVKGSRSAAMERVVDLLVDAFGRGELV
ncbi:UDP-N-acetylmuramoyl-tripeptide--D-alanyl-D-alanine ligase [Shewanella sp. OMA3-2]|uniref:UDP-N-acetylmuramoyl-tripeptide--D-alanyl-D- alanine ligase n=1 Tax=Shewanella sp. OMA3-2 TaxID=2908650 RepID=UPI001F2821DA|nr:UDP-N-acetylmuramoyl-tripeptide--D-alanyl-D-alanine ligase [Shewanella sp. OMA3-2]UJF22465.1 UDP-N-acetylmuramoyl-tripeptide--D-alanyl-D-alanine ligase [Shewanella sp. OMA3-2]